VNWLVPGVLVLSELERKESKAKRKAEDKARRNPPSFYRPFTWVPPVVEKVFDKKGKERVKVIKRGYMKQTHETGAILTSGEKTYKVQEGGTLVRVDLEVPRAARRKKKNS
jgi:hypothetical protein